MTTRRKFLHVLGTSTGAIALAGIPVSCGAPAEGAVDAGNVDDYGVGDLRGIEGSTVAVGRDKDGFYALTAICTHLQCNMNENGEIKNSGLSCDCHGSSFNSDGTVANGPAAAPLEHYAVEIADDGAITVQVGSVVDDNERAEA